jgi:hypothetical protein
VSASLDRFLLSAEQSRIIAFQSCLHAAGFLTITALIPANRVLAALRASKPELLMLRRHHGIRRLRSLTPRGDIADPQQRLRGGFTSVVERTLTGIRQQLAPIPEETRVATCVANSHRNCRVAHATRIQYFPGGMADECRIRPSAPHAVQQS